MSPCFHNSLWERGNDNYRRWTGETVVTVQSILRREYGWLRRFPSVYSVRLCAGHFFSTEKWPEKRNISFGNFVLFFWDRLTEDSSVNRFWPKIRLWDQPSFGSFRPECEGREFTLPSYTDILPTPFPITCPVLTVRVEWVFSEFVCVGRRRWINGLTPVDLLP